MGRMVLDECCVEAVVLPFLGPRRSRPYTYSAHSERPTVQGTHGRCPAHQWHPRALVALQRREAAATTQHPRAALPAALALVPLRTVLGQHCCIRGRLRTLRRRPLAAQHLLKAA